MKKRNRSVSTTPRVIAGLSDSQATKFMRKKKGSRSLLQKSEMVPDVLEEDYVGSPGREETTATFERMRSLGFLMDAEDDGGGPDERVVTPRAAIRDDVLKMIAKYDIDGSDDDDGDAQSGDDAETLRKWKDQSGRSALRYIADDVLLMEKSLLEKDQALIKAIFATVSSEDYDEIAQAVVILFEANKQSNGLLEYLIHTEINRASTARSFRETIFREDTIASKVFSHYLKLVGTGFLEILLMPYMTRIVSNPTQYYDVESSLQNFNILVEGLIKRILASTDSVPPQIQSLCFYVEKEVRKRSPESVLTALGNLIFLRFISHAMVSPVDFKLLDEKPQPDATRVLVMIAKVLQNVMNDVSVSESSALYPTNGIVELYSSRMHHFLSTIPRWVEARTLSQGVRIQRDFALEKLQRYLRNHLEEVATAYSEEKGGRGESSASEGE